MGFICVSNYEIYFIYVGHFTVCAVAHTADVNIFSRYILYFGVECQSVQTPFIREIKYEPVYPGKISHNLLLLDMILHLRRLCYSKGNVHSQSKNEVQFGLRFGSQVFI
jgi:hypothetical protein